MTGPAFLDDFDRHAQNPAPRAGLYKKVAVAVSLSPRREAMLAEASRLAEAHHAELLVIHLGHASEHVTAHLTQCMERQHIDERLTQLICLTSPKMDQLGSVCASEGADLLMIGAVRRPAWSDFIHGSAARRIIRSSPIPVLALPDPSRRPKPIQEIVVATQSADGAPWLVQRAMLLARAEGASRIHILSQTNAYELAKAAMDISGQQMQRVRRELVGAGTRQARAWAEPHQALTEDFDIAISTKVIAGRPGVAWAEYVHRHHADVLIMDAPATERLGFWGRLGNPTFEYMMQELPCNLMLVR